MSWWNKDNDNEKKCSECGKEVGSTYVIYGGDIMCNDCHCSVFPNSIYAMCNSKKEEN